MINELKILSELNSTSGREKNVRNYIISQIKDIADYSIDALGNLLVFKKGKSRPKNKVMLASHMDEVGLIITYITDDGFLKFTTVGGVDTKVILGRCVRIGENNINGVIGVKPVHLLKKDEKSVIPEKDNLYIDIGAKSKDEASELVQMGDTAYFNSDFVEFGEGCIKAKALDDRVGCAIMLEIIKSELLYDTYFAFTVQEEVGLIGAKTAAFNIAPDYAIVVETTTAADINGVKGHKRVCSLADGAVISFMDRATVYDKELYDLAFEIADKKSIAVQPKTVVAGGNDAGSIHCSGKGVKTLTVSLPCRYLHSPSCVINKKDIDSVLKIVSELSIEFARR
ncbi:MAG TPA: M42 family metallopeptidase [Clostridia bacterium]|nr:M42 family metallopeptidase [Clostridia bacterium]